MNVPGVPSPVSPAAIPGRSGGPANARDNRRQPSPEILDGARVRAAQSEPSFLHGVVRFSQRAEHPLRHRSQMAPVLLKPFRQPLMFDHTVTFSSWRFIILTVTNQSPPM